jgi:hypothetical protein
MVHGTTPEDEMFHAHAPRISRYIRRMSTDAKTPAQGRCFRL